MANEFESSEHGNESNRNVSLLYKDKLYFPGTYSVNSIWVNNTEQMFKFRVANMIECALIYLIRTLLFSYDSGNFIGIFLFQKLFELFAWNPIGRPIFVIDINQSAIFKFVILMNSSWECHISSCCLFSSQHFMVCYCCCGSIEEEENTSAER